MRSFSDRFPDRHAFLLGERCKQDWVREACAGAGLHTERPGRFGPGRHVLLLVTADSLHSILAEVGDARRFAQDMAVPVVVLVEGSETPEEIRRFTEADAVCVPPDYRLLLPEVLRRLTALQAV